MNNSYKNQLLISSMLILVSFAAVAVNISPPPAFQPSAVSSYRFTDIYTLPGGEQRAVALNPHGVQLLLRGGTNTFITTLEREFPQWAFTPAEKSLTGIFVIENYYACGLATPDCGVERTEGKIAVGAFIDISYQPGPGDPTPADNELHWIQRIYSNHDAIAQHGVNADKVDNLNDSDGVTVEPCDEIPYYDCAFLADETFFVDRPQRTADHENDHVWAAELYLVEQTDNKQVTIYDGIKWGWLNTNLGIRALVAPPSDIRFDNPSPAITGDVVAGGFGTHAISWGVPAGGKSPSTLVIDRHTQELRPLIGEPFQLGTVTYTNSTIQSGTGINSAELTIETVVDVIGMDINGLSILDNRLVSMVNTANTCNARTPGDCTSEQARESADYVSIPPVSDLTAVPGSFPDFEELGNNFHVHEESTATATLIGRITQVRINTAENNTDGLLPPGPNAPAPGTLNPEPVLVWEILGFGAVVRGRGFITIGEAGISIDDEINRSGKVTIGYDSDQPLIDRKSQSDLQQLIRILIKQPRLSIDIKGHSDNSGSPRINQQLSLERAEELRGYLIQHGIGKGRITMSAHGQDKPIASNNTEAGRAQNRRVELVINSR